MRDIRYAVRVLIHAPAFTAAALLCLGLGIGATTAIFTVLHRVVVRPLPYREPERLVRLYSEFPNFPNGGLRRFWISPPEYLDLRREMQSFESLDGWVGGGVNVAGGNEPVRVTSCGVTGGLLRSLGASPLLGRALAPEDDAPGANPAAVISYGLWQRAFGGSRDVVGRTIQVNGRNSTVAGVMPVSFQFPPGEVDSPEIWVPLQIDPAKPGGRGSHFLYLLGRLKPGVGIGQARDEMGGLVRQWRQAAAPNTHSLDPQNHYLISHPLHMEVVGGVRPALLTLLGAVGFVLLIACVNVANLLLARAEARQREIAIRRAMGAALPQLIRQFVMEGVVLALGGALVGLLLAFVGLRLIVAAGQTSIPRAAEIGIDVPVLLFTLAVSTATGLFFGLAPLSQLVARNPQQALQASTGRTTATAGAQLFRAVLVAGEMALALVLLIGAGLMVRAFWKLQEVETGLVAERVLTMRVSLPQAVYGDNKALLQFWNGLQDGLAAVPGVESASMMSGLPPVRPLNANDTQIEGFVQTPGGPMQNVDFWQTAGRRYFETMGIRLVEGRFFDDRDGEGAPATVIVNQTMARTFWPGQSALGRRVRPGFRDRDPWCTIVGVVGDVKNTGLDRPAGAELYLPYRQMLDRGFGLRGPYVVVRAKGDPGSVARAVRQEIRSLDGALPVAQVRAMEEVLAAARSRPRFLTLLLTLFSVLALTLAGLGTYSVISYSVARRTAEIGIRMAMGAQPGDVLAMVLGQGLRLGAIGVAAGAVGAYAVTRLIGGMLFGMESFDPATFAAMAAGLLGVTAVACWAPARRATRVDPMVALRYD